MPIIDHARFDVTAIKMKRLSGTPVTRRGFTGYRCVVETSPMSLPLTIARKRAALFGAANAHPGA
jgi:hypothetical protein